MFTVDRVGISVYSRTDRDYVYSRPGRDKCSQ